ncbi:hypothetical protein [Brachybacterium hainanense]|uniref:ABC transporter permease n=1 Tax=Brachybacterium hainanense TaxID=1541174 RepID=A0ABV6RHS6_9MICO
MSAVVRSRPVPALDATGGLRRALRVEARLHREMLGGTVILGAAVMILAGLVSDAPRTLLPLWAVAAWYRLGRHDGADRAVLNAGLGLSRVDALRARLILVGLDAAVTLAFLAASGVLAVLSGHDTSGSGTSALVAGHGLADALLGVPAEVLWTAAALVLTAVMVGRASTTRRPGIGAVLLAAASGLGAYLLVALVLMAVGAVGGILLGVVRGTDAAPVGDLPMWAGIFTALLACLVLGLLWLRRSIRGWIRDLDGDERNGRDERSGR